MSFITAAIIGGGASLIGGAIAANGAKGAAAKAADANLRSTQMTNEANQKFFDLSRGAPGADGFGHSLLPNYFGGNEQDFGKQAYSYFQKMNGAGDQTFNNSMGYQNAMRPSFDAGMSAFNNRFNGQDLAQRQAYANPYYQARLNQAGTYGQGMRDVAGAQASGINTGLMQAIAQMNAQRGRQGFLGSSTFDRNRMGMATIGARQQAGMSNAMAGAGANNLMSDAMLANAGDMRGMQMADLDFRSRLDAFPAAMGAVNSFENMPSAAMASAFNTAAQPLNFFRMQPQAFQQQGMPMQEPQISNAGILGGAISQAGQTYGNYSMMNQMMSRMGQQNPYTMASANTGMGAMGGYQPMAGATSFSNPYAAQMPTQFNYSMQPQPGY